MKNYIAGGVALFTFLGILGTASPLLAARPQLDNGSGLDQEKPYEHAQAIADVLDNKAVYGKLDGASAADIYSFKPDRDADQMISLMSKATDSEEASSQPVLILIDPTDATEEQSLGVPLPSDEYHPALITSLEKSRTFVDPILLQKFSVTSEQKIALKKDQTYYLVVIEPYGQPANYVLRFGEGNPWTAQDLFSNLGTWFRLQTDTYAGSSPFAFPASAIALIIFFLGLSVVTGLFVIEHTLSFLANRSKAAAYVLVKFESYYRIITWIALWFLAIGLYMHFDQAGFIGIPFVLTLLFIALVVSLLVYTIRFSPRLIALEVNKREATIPLPLRKRLFFSFVVSLVLLAAFIVMLAVYLNK